MNLVYVDGKRPTYRFLDVDRCWKKCNSTKICSKIIKVFIPKIEELIEHYRTKQSHYSTIKNQLGEKKTLATMTAKAKFDKYHERITELNEGFYEHIRSKKSNPEGYIKFVQKFRDMLKPRILIRETDSSEED